MEGNLAISDIEGKFWLGSWEKLAREVAQTFSTTIGPTISDTDEWGGGKDDRRNKAMKTR